MPIISVIVPVYNAEKRLAYCLNSLVNQTILKKDPNSLEIVIVNDASTDRSGLLIEYYRRLYPNIITVINKSQNKGVSVARNEGIKASKGKYIGFVDNDDYVALNMYEDFVNTMLRYDVNMVSGGFFNTTKHIGTFESEKLKETDIQVYDNLEDKYDNMGKYSQSIWNRIYKREALEKHLFLPGHTDEDAGVFFPLITEYGKTILLPHTYYAYWSREDNFSSMLNNQITDRLLDIFDVAMDAFRYCSEKNYDNMQMYYLNSLFGKTALCNLRNIYDWQVAKKNRELMHKIYMDTYQTYVSLFDVDNLEPDLRRDVIMYGPSYFPEVIQKDDIPQKLELIRKDINKLM